MDGIILAGGLGKRMHPLTLQLPKPLLPLQSSPILEWSLASLRGIVERVLVVVHYRKAQIAAYMNAQSLVADYVLVEQLPEPLGTGHALQCCRDYLESEHFLVINGDDLYSHSALRDLSSCEFGILSLLRDDYDRYGVIVTDSEGHFQRIDEKPPRDRYPRPAPCNIGAYKFTTSIFNYLPAKSDRGEIEITDFVTAAARDQAIAVVDSPFWLPIGDPHALEAAQDVDIKRWIPLHPRGT